MDYEPLARARMSASAWAYLQGGAADELTLADNLQAFQRLRLLPRVLNHVADGNTRLTLFGQQHAAPILLAPVAFQQLAHPEGERASALAAAAMRTGMVVSTQSGIALETLAQDVKEAQTPLWFQLYIQPDREFTRALVARAQAAGYQALVVTVDAPVHGARNREQRAGFKLPQGISPVNLHGMRGLPAEPVRAGESLLQTALVRHAPTWDDVAWLRSISSLPILLKGILSPEDARRAVDAGMAGVIVSNHGGRTLDSTPATIDALPAYKPLHKTCRCWSMVASAVAPTSSRRWRWAHPPSSSDAPFSMALRWQAHPASYTSCTCCARNWKSPWC